MSVTQREIARSLNVSFMAVQRALNSSGYISDTLRKRILDYARKVNYRPHRGAQALVRKRPRLVALFSTDFPSFFWNQVARGVRIASDQIAPFGFEVQYHRVKAGDGKRFAALVSRTVSEDVKAVGIVYNDSFDMGSLFDLLGKRSVPFITFNVDAPQSGRVCFVGPDYVQEGVMAADILGKLLGGRGRAGVISSPDSHFGKAEGPGNIHVLRRRGFLAWMESQYSGVAVKELPLSYTLPDRQIRQGFSDWFAREGRKTDALYCIPSYQVSIARALEEMGRGGKVPLVTFDLSDEIRALIRRDIVTATICQKPVQQGYYAVKLLEALTDDPSLLRKKEYYLSPYFVMKGNVDIDDDLFTLTAPELR